jgi:hypothetical protein
MAGTSVVFEHHILGFSLTIPSHWTIASSEKPDAIPGFESVMQKRPDDLPAPGDLRHVLTAAEIIVAEYGRLRCHIELSLWKDNPFTLPTRAKKYPLGELPFKARVGKYGNGGQHAAGQLDLGDGLVLHLVTRTDEPSATTDLAAVLATGRKLPRVQPNSP